MAFAAPTAELSHIAPDILLEYLRGAISRLASSPSLAQRLGKTTAVVERAITATFEDLCAASSAHGSTSQLKLVFRHDCQNLTCLNPRCPLCCQNPNKRCPDSVHFASKYLEKNPLRSRCGANIRIEVVNSGTGEPAHPHLLQDVVLELSMVDGKKYGSRNETGEDIASCELFAAPTKAGSKADKGKPLLNPGRMGSHTPQNRVRMALTARGHAVLGTDFTVQVSSEAMLGGQKAPYKLLVRAVSQETGLEVPYITFVASEDFVVATPRVAKAVKAEIPCVDDPVGKLEDIGDKTKEKLNDLPAAAEICGAHALSLPFTAVTTVGHFKQLVELSNSDPSFNEKLKQYLIPNKAREHVAQAVENDKRLRMWYPEPNNVEGGLLYRSVRARVDLEHPDVLVQHQVLADGSMEPELTPCGQAQGDKKEQLRQLINKAKEDWGAADHPNWSIRDMDSAHFLDSNLQPGLQTAYASVPENRQLDHTLGLGSGSSSSRSQQGSGHLGSGQLGSGQLGSGQLGSGVLGLNHSQGSGQFQELLGRNRSGSGASGWLRGSGSGVGQFGSPNPSGAGPSQPDSPFAINQEQQYQNPGPSHYTPGGQSPSSSAFGGFPPPASTSPFLNFNAPHSPQGDNIFPNLAPQMQPTASQPGSASLANWGSGSGTATGSGNLPQQYSDQSRSLQDLQNTLSSQGSPSIGNGPFGSNMGHSSGGAAGHSPALSQSSVPSHATNGQAFHHGLGSGGMADSVARPGLDRIDSGFAEPDPKRQRPPLQPQSGSNSSAYHHPSTEIALQQHMLRQQHSGGHSPMGSGSLFESLGHQHGTDANQLHMHSQATGSGSMQGGQQQAAPQQPQAQLGNPNLQKNLLDQLQDLPTDDNFLSDEYLLSENSMHFLGPTDTPPQEPHTARPPPNPSNPPPPLHNYLANDSRSEPMRNHVRFSPMPTEPSNWRLPHTSAPITSPSPRSSSPMPLDLDPRASSEDLINNAHPNLNGIDPARARWSQKDRWSSGNIFASFTSNQRKQLGASGKSDGLESMRDIQDCLTDLEDMDADLP